MIQFDKDLSTSKHLWLFNNNIIRFSDDGTEAALTAEIVTTDFTVRSIYPDTNGLFYFDFQEYIIAAAIQNNFADDFSPSIDNTIASLIYDETDKVIYSLDVEIKINLENDTQVTTNKTYNFIIGVEDLFDYQRQERHQLELFLHSKLESYNNLKYNLNYWEGYPFTISVFTSTFGDLNIKNESNGLDVNLPVANDNKVNRIVFSDASSSITLEDHLPLLDGINRLTVTRPGFDNQVDEDSPISISLKKHVDKCGHYVKFLNRSGRWSYWLFNKQLPKSRRVSGLEELNNDFENIEDTVSPTIQTGVKNSQDTITGYAVNLEDIDIDYLSEIIESPKIYLFTGEPFSVNETETDHQWIEVSCETSSLEITKPKNKKSSFPIEFKLPIRKTMSLL